MVENFSKRAIGDNINPLMAAVRLEFETMATGQFLAAFF
jgi:hypothetical protein